MVFYSSHNWVNEIRLESSITRRQKMPVKRRSVSVIQPFAPNCESVTESFLI